MQAGKDFFHATFRVIDTFGLRWTLATLSRAEGMLSGFFILNVGVKSHLILQGQYGYSTIFFLEIQLAIHLILERH